MAKSKLSYEEKIAAIKEYKAGQGSYQTIALKYGISKTTFRDMIMVYKSQGLAESKKNKKYSKELKRQAVKEYLTGEASQTEICQKYKIKDRKQLRQWIKWYNGHKEKGRSSAKGEVYMTKGRKTTQEERVEIVAYCIEHGKDYGLTAETYQVSYQQIYAWVKKYEEKGVKGLVDGRGKIKTEDELTEAERLKQENKILRAKIKDKEMEIALLKKLRELRGGDW